MDHGNGRETWLRALYLAGVLLLSALWLFAVWAVWDRGRLSWGQVRLLPKSGFLPFDGRLPRGHFLTGTADRFRDRRGVSAFNTYLCLLPLVLWSFCLTALLPETVKLFFPGRKRLLALYWSGAGIALLFGLLCAAASYTSPLFFLKNRPLRAFLETANLDLIPLGAALSLFGWWLPVTLRRGRESWREHRLGSRVKGGAVRVLLGIGGAFLITVFSGLLLASIRPLAPGAVRFVDGFCRENSRYDSSFAVSVFMAPLMEELAFRGLIQRGLRAAARPWSTVLITAVFFGLWHRNTGQFVYTFAFALLVGWIYEYSGKLRYTVLTHCLINLLTIMCYSEDSGAILGRIPVLPPLRKAILLLPPLTAAVLLALIGGLLVLLVRGFRETEQQNDTE